MRRRELFRTLLLGVANGACPRLWRLSATQGYLDVSRESAGLTNVRNADSETSGEMEPRRVPLSTEEMAERVFAREQQVIKTLEGYSPLVETRVVRRKRDRTAGIAPKSELYSLGRADLRREPVVHTIIAPKSPLSFCRRFDPAGFVQMIYVDRCEFDAAHYKLTYQRHERADELSCLVFDVSPAPNAGGARFVGRICVEDRNFTIVRINGNYSPSAHFSVRRLEEDYYLHFESQRTEVEPGLWLPSTIYSQQIIRYKRFADPPFKAETRFWGYRLIASVQ
jgi:hypothetical protein